MALAPLLASIVGWLRVGYPDGVPSRDYLPLFALLAGQLSDEDVSAIADELTDPGDPASRQEVRDAIEMVTHAEPNDADVARVRAHLTAGGWPLTQHQRRSS